MLHLNSRAQFGGALVRTSSASAGPGPVACARGSDWWCRRRPAGFTMVELLVVIVVLGLLITLVTTLGARAIRQQRVRNTQQIMQNVTLALEQFATENPLRAVYHRKGRETFGKFPPYQLANWVGGSVGHLLEADHSLTALPNDVPDTLQERLAWDLSGRSTGITLSNWALIGATPPGTSYPDGHDDNRALYAYLKVFSPGVMSLIPENALKPLYPHVAPADRSYVNANGTGAAQGISGAEDVLGIHDAWGVPLDYMLYVKCEWGLRRNPITGQPLPNGFRVVERRPVLRSRGIKRELYDEWVRSDPDDPTLREVRLSPPDKWIFSAELPRPWFGGGDPTDLNDDGSFGFTGSDFNGWVRAVGLNEDYAYRPEGDTAEP